MAAAYTPAKLAPGIYPYWENGKETGNYCSIMGVYWDNGKENGNYYSIMGYIQKMETTVV